MKLMIKDAEIKKVCSANAYYTGGGFYLYIGMLHDGTYFICADDWCSNGDYAGYVMIVDCKPTVEQACDSGWLDKHKLTELNGISSYKLWYQMLMWITTNKPQGGNYSGIELDLRVSMSREQIKRFFAKITGN